MKYTSEIEKLEKLFSQKRYFELISIGVQFIDFFSSKLTEYIPIDDIPQDQLDELEAHTGIPPKNWKKLKKEIAKSLKSDDSWKYKFLGILDGILNTSISPCIDVTPSLITKVRSLHKFRNDLQHEYYKSKITANELEKNSKECLEICKLFKHFDEEGYLD
ncbi:hypothetical protein JKY72_05570 [Candidatus Gracilibacteria bacterium]|nr:hypothetical protein [Candidatus Gracilibacteria bacterium]